jgi:mycothiol synthase
MSSYQLRHPRHDEVAAAAKVVIDYEVALYGSTTYAREDLEAEWADFDLDNDAWVADAAGRIVGYAALYDRGELFRGELYVHPDANVDSIGTGTAALLESVASDRGARRLQIGVFLGDEVGRSRLAARGYRPVRNFREMRIELSDPPEPAAAPAGLRFDDFDPERDAQAFHAAHQEAFSDHWEHTPRTFEAWSKWHLGSDKFDTGLWSMMLDGDEIVGGAICTANTYGGGWVHSLFTRRPWRGRGVGGALLQDSFVRLWSRGERTVGLGVDAEGETGAFRVYERAGMKPALGWVMFEKELGDAA